MSLLAACCVVGHSSLSAQNSALFDFPYSIRGPGAGCFVDEAGLTWFAAVGDVDGDGFDDYALIEASRQTDICTASVTTQQIATLRSGRTGAVLFSDPNAPNLSAAGDVNGDGFDDLLWRMPGQVGRVLRGPDGVELFRLATAELVVMAGDVNADGHDDLAASRGGTDVELLSGVDGSVLRVLTPAGSPGGLGRFDIAAVGDVDGDGFADLLIGSPGVAAAGVAELFSGRRGALLQTLLGDPAALGFGRSVTGAGDVDDDGVPDLIVNGASEAMLFSGATAAVLRREPGGRLGAVGDVDTDGQADLILNDQQIVSGADSSVLIQISQGALTAVGDVDNDGVDDFVALDLSGVGGTLPLLFGAAGMQLVPPPPIGVGREERVGVGCSGLTGRIRRVAWRGEADLGSQIALWLRGGRSGFGAVVQLGLASDVPLGAIGAPGCSLLVRPFTTVGAVGSGPGGVPRFDLRLAFGALPLGTQLRLQWAVWDPGTNQLGVTTSDALELTIGS